MPVPSKGQENILLRRPPVSRASSSQEGLSELAADTVVRGKSSSGVEGMISSSNQLPYSPMWNKKFWKQIQFN